MFIYSVLLGELNPPENRFVGGSILLESPEGKHVLKNTKVIAVMQKKYQGSLLKILACFSMLLKGNIFRRAFTESEGRVRLMPEKIPKNN